MQIELVYSNKSQNDGTASKHPFSKGSFCGWDLSPQSSGRPNWADVWLQTDQRGNKSQILGPIPILPWFHDILPYLKEKKKVLWKRKTYGLKKQGNISFTLERQTSLSASRGKLWRVFLFVCFSFPWKALADNRVLTAICHHRTELQMWTSKFLIF